MGIHPPAAHLIIEELRQLAEEGYDVSSLAGWRTRAEEAPASLTRQSYREVLALVHSLPRQPGYAYHEPSSLAEIRAARADGPRTIAHSLDDAALADRMLGAWLGRTAGCMLGKPIEGWPREQIRMALEHAGCYPLDGYFPRIPSPPEGMHYPGVDHPCLRGNIVKGERDDDMDYPLVGLLCLQARGGDFTSADVAHTWLHHLPAGCVYTAERVAYQNLVNEIEPPASGAYENPYREWIGAQIRADIWGWVNPGKPERAAEFAHRDACVSHVKNGIYGEMYFAAAMAAAMVVDDLDEVLRIALSEIPAECRLAEAVRDVTAWAAEDADWHDTMDRVFAKYGHYHGVHTINNAAVVLCGLLHSKGDYGKAICIAVMGGIDTDCNGATAGSVMGALLGAKALPLKWVAPLNDRLESIVIGYTDNRISELAERTLDLAKGLA
jgi:ADP-ribosylglycohydrolase